MRKELGLLWTETRQRKATGAGGAGWEQGEQRHPQGGLYREHQRLGPRSLMVTVGVQAPASAVRALSLTLEGNWFWPFLLGGAENCSGFCGCVTLLSTAQPATCSQTPQCCADQRSPGYPSAEGSVGMQGPEDTQGICALQIPGQLINVYFSLFFCWKTTSRAAWNFSSNLR